MLCRLLVDHQKIITIEEHSLISGMGSIINHFLMTNGYQHVQVMNFGIPETFVEHGSHQELLHEIGLTPEQILKDIVRHFNLTLETTVPELINQES